MPAENPQQWNRLSTSSVSPISGSASGENGIGPLTQVWMPSSPNSGIRARRTLGDAGEAIVVRREQFGPEVERDAAPGRAGALLPAADDQAAGLGLEVEARVRIAQGRQVVRDRVGLLRDDVLVLDGVDGDVGAGQPRGLGAPHAGRVDEHVALDAALLGAHRRHPPAGALDARHPAVLHDPHPGRAGAGGERMGELVGVDVAVARDPRRPVHAGQVEQREQLARLGRRREVHVEAEAAPGRGQSPELVQRSALDASRRLPTPRQPVA